MTYINVYLTFDGNCEEAFTFYQKVFGGEFAHFGRFEDMPPQDGFDIAEKHKKLVMHASLPISKETVLMGSDVAGEWGKDFKKGNNFSVSISADSKSEADRFFKELSADGQVTMLMADTFWGSYFGSLIDQFGINWMVGYDGGNSQ